jgi:hypothetical protein
MIVSTKMTPIYVFSMPRSGSTLLQRMLARHPKIDTVSETWMLLPLLYSLKGDGLISEYKHEFFLQARDDLAPLLGDGDKAFYPEVREYAMSIYRKLAHDHAEFFVDKTPPYTLIAQEIMNTFPDAKFIFLWRNPLAVVASIMSSWAGGRFNLFRVRNELFRGMRNMCDAFEANKHRACSIRYEELCANPDSELRRLYKYIFPGLELHPLRPLHEVKVRGGRMGDDSVMRESPLVSNEMHAKWKAVMCNPVRKRWCRKYLEWLGEDSLRRIGYNQGELLAELESVPFGMKHIASDCVRQLYGGMNAILEIELVARKLRRLRSGQQIYSYS